MIILIILHLSLLVKFDLIDKGEFKNFNKCGQGHIIRKKNTSCYF